MKSEKNNYIGDEAFEKFLRHYACFTPINLVKMKFVGAICSPNLGLRPADVISSFWEKGKEPRIETKQEADLFFKFFMGLWDNLFDKVKNNNAKLFKLKTRNKDELIDACYYRSAEIEHGFIEGFWGGKQNFKIPAYVAELIDSLSELAEVYQQLAKKLDNNTDFNQILSNFTYTDKMVDKAISFIIENQVLPKMDNLNKVVN